MSRKRKNGGLGVIIAILILWRVGILSVAGILGFLLLFGISISVIVGLSRASRDKNAPNVKVDTSASSKDNVNPYSSGYRASAQNNAMIAAQNDAAAAAQRAAEEQRLRELKKKEEELKNQYTSYGEKKRKRTGDKDIDALLDEEEKAIAEMRRLDDAILDEKVSAQIVHLEEVTSKIVDCIVEKPKKRPQVKKFFSYYLPTTLKLLNSYDRMDEVGISGTNIDGAKGSIESLLDTALAAFDKELDSLYGDEAIDVNSDIKVMESMLAQDGLTEDELQKMLKV